MIDFTLYPNLNGQLGQNKVAIPDGVTTFWPDGDALVENFIYKDGKLVGLIDTKALIENDSKTTVLPYDYVDITLDKRLETLMTFNAGERCKHLNVKYDIFLPKGYKRLEYLESTGTQYLPTLHFQESLTAYVEIDCQFTSSAGRQLLGFDTKTLYWGVNEGRWEKALAYFDTPPVLERYTHKAQVYNNKGGQLEIGTFTAPIKNQNETVSNFIFRINSTLIYRLFSFKLSTDYGLIHNFIPCLDPNGAPCMYDIISQEPFYNEGTGQFLYPGAESQVVTSDLDENFYAKKTEHGIQRLYKTPDDYSGTKDDYAIENGFKQLVEPPMPTDGHWSPQWIETDTQLICNWVEAEEMEML